MNFRTILPLICLLTLFLSCNGVNSKAGNQTNDSIGGNLEELEKLALSSKNVTDTVLLDYRFGMTKEQVLNHTKKLYREGKLKKDYSGQYYFEITSITTEIYKGFLFAEYLEKKLFSVGLTFSDETSNTMVFSTLRDLYKQKYGGEDLFSKPISDMALYESYWLRNNLKIRLTTGMSEASVRYIDLRYEKLKEHADSLEKASSEQKVKNNL